MESLLYRLLAVPGLSEAALGRILVGWGADPAESGRFWERAAAEYQRGWGLSARAAVYLAEEAKSEKALRAAEVLTTLARAAEIELLTVQEDDYAALARERGLPPVLFTRGNQDLLWAGGVAVAQSRDAPEAALAWGAALAAALADAGVQLVSSHNRDGYRRVAAAAKRAAAAVVIVLDRPLHDTPGDGPRAEPVSTARLWDERFHPERQVIVSGRRPGERWQPRHGRGRDALVMGVATVVVAGGVREDGTMAGLCRQAIRAGRTVFGSPFCPAELGGEPLPAEIPAAAERVAAAVELAVGLDGGGHGRRVGWIERQRAASVAAFMDGLGSGAGEGVLVRRLPAAPFLEGDPAERRAWLAAGLRAIIHLPAWPGAGEREVVLLTVSGAREDEVLLMEPDGAVESLEALRRYLSGCRARVAARSTVRSP